MSFFLGIDAGGSKTECVLADEAGVLLARAAGPGANLRRTDREELTGCLGACLQSLRRIAGLDAIKFQVVCAGFAGAADSAARALAEDVLTWLLSPRWLRVVGDMEVALEAAVGDGPGVVLIAGTGSIAYGRNAPGKVARAGGQGPQINAEGKMVGDVGSANYLAWRFSQEAGGDQPAEFVLRAAQQGNPLARRIRDDAAIGLADLALSVLRQLGLLDRDARVVLSGGVLLGDEELAALVRQKLLTAAPKAQVEPLTISPAEGAVRLAQRLWLREQAGKNEP